MNHSYLLLLNKGLACALIGLISCAMASTKTQAQEQKWVASWAGSAHGPYPSGNAVAQPELSEILPPGGANDQTFRLIVKPDLWARGGRLRFSNVFPPADRVVAFVTRAGAFTPSAGQARAGQSRVRRTLRCRKTA